MRYLLPSLIIILILCVAGIYVFIPSQVAFSKVAIMKAKLNVANRFLMDQNRWGEWFPAASRTMPASADANGYKYKDHFYAIARTMMNTAEVTISNEQTSLKSLVNMISLYEDSVAIEWKSELPESSGFTGRIKNYFRARQLQRDMGVILKYLENFLKDNDKVYGVHIHEIISRDSTLIATKTITTGHPATSDIYGMIGSLKKYIREQGARENNFPMMNVKKINETEFETMIAIPVNKYLEGNGALFPKRFVPWKVLTAEVKGGTRTVDEALHQMEIYITDYHREAMAIPFQSLITDRSTQPDTLKWITAIYTPVR